MSQAITREARRTCELRHRCFQLRVLTGPDAGAVATAATNEVSVGTAPGNQLVLTDPLVSRHHLRIRWMHGGYWLRDLGSRNGTQLGDLVVEAVALRDGAELVIGDSRLVFELLDREISEPLAAEPRWGSILGESAAMRRLFAMLPRVARTDTTVLIEGETGTGKSILAREIHKASARAHGPFVVVDCSAIPPTLIESALFGHEKGAFTGACAARPGAFEAARGGTVFLDEIGELPLDMQPKLLRVLEAREVQRVGRVDSIPLDVRVIAATNQDLRNMVNRSTFRADLYYRLNVVTLDMPSLCDRSDDIPGLVASFYSELTGGAAPPAALLVAFAKRSWPGNVRELKNAVERTVVLDDLAFAETDLEPVPPSFEAGTDGPTFHDRVPFDPSVPFRDAKEQAMGRWVRWYIGELMRHTNGNLSHAARLSQSDRSYLRRLLRRYADESTGVPIH